MSKRFRQVFHKRHVILPVIHATNADQVIRNLGIVSEEKCDGAFLINHSISASELVAVYEIARQEFPLLWLGLNCLGLSANSAMNFIPASVDGLWTDNALIVESDKLQVEALEVCKTVARRNWQGLYFGGVAFKYQPAVRNLRRVASLAASYMDVITTSGPGTGQAASIAKVQTMRSESNDAPLAIASGITPENVTDYLPYVDAFLVATGISQSFTELDRGLVRQLVANVARSQQHSAM